MCICYPHHPVTRKVKQCQLPFRNACLYEHEISEMRHANEDWPLKSWQMEHAKSSTSQQWLTCLTLMYIWLSGFQWEWTEWWTTNVSPKKTAARECSSLSSANTAGRQVLVISANFSVLYKLPDSPYLSAILPPCLSRNTLATLAMRASTPTPSA